MSTPAPIRVTVIGRGGQVATALTARLAGAAYALTVLGRPDIDLARPETLKPTILAARPHVVVNPAAYTAVDKAEDEPDLAHTVNGTAAGMIAAAAAEAGAPVVHLSTDYVFDGTKRTPYVETDPVAPIGAYGASKLAGEKAVAAANPAHIILRTAWVCSPTGHNFVKTVLRLGAERPSLRVVDDQSGAPTFAADLAEAIAKMLPRLAAGTVPPGSHGVFHCASAGETTWCRFARAILAGAKARGAKVTTEVTAITTDEFPTKARRPAYSKLNTAKFERVWGVAMPRWDVGLEKCLDGVVDATSHIVRVL